jgi:hypothetical protein
VANPHYRAFVLKGHLATLPELVPEAAAAARAAVGPETIRLIERTPGAEWLPSRPASDMVAAVEAVAGLEQVRVFGRGVGFRGFDAAVLRPMVAAARGLFGPNPILLVRLFPPAWRIGTQSCGAFAVTSHGRDWARLGFTAVPEELQSVGQLMGIAGVLEGTLLRCGAASARVEVVYQPGAAQATFELSWR